MSLWIHRLFSMALLILLSGNVNCGTITLTDSNGDPYVLTLADEITVTTTGEVRIPIAEPINGLPNEPPQAQDDFFSASNIQPSALNLLQNDTDPDGSIDPNSLQLVGDSVGGNFVTMPGGNVQFLPHGGFNGVATQSYRVSDNLGGLSNLAVVSITVTGQPCPSDPQPGMTPVASPNTYDHCAFGIVTQFSLLPGQYYALAMDMVPCPETSGRIFWDSNLVITASRCPGVTDDSYPPMEGDPFATSCSPASSGVGNLLWTLSDEQFRCRIYPGQRVFLNIVKDCQIGPCQFILQPLLGRQKGNQDPLWPGSINVHLRSLNGI